MKRLLPFLLVACAAPDPGQVKIIGHGGMGADANQPMDSYEALIGGLDLGIDGIEMDVQLTADSVLVVHHDLTLEKTTACTGRINDHTWAELQACPVALEGRTYPIVRVDSLLTRIAREYPKTECTFDCKLNTRGDWWGYLQAFADAIAELDRDTAITQGHYRINVECKVKEFLQLMEQSQPSIDTYIYASEFNAGVVDTAVANKFTGITISHERMTAEQVAQAHAHGLEITLFGLASHSDHDAAFSKGVDRVQTDAPGLFKR